MTSLPPSRASVALGAAAAFTLAGVVFATPAMAVSTTVSTEQELVDAINAANANPDADTIVLAGSGFELTAGLPVITSAITLAGPGSDLFTLVAHEHDFINAQVTDAAFAFAISGVTVSNTGYIGVYADGPSVSIDDLVIAEGTADEACGLELRNLSGTVKNSEFRTGCDYSTVESSVPGTVTISDTVFSGIGTDGVIVDIDSSAQLVLDNVVSSNNDGAGFTIVAAGNAVVTVSGGSAIGNEANGITLSPFDDAQVGLEGVEVSDNAANGVQMDASERAIVTIDGVTAERNGSADDFDYGLQLAATGNTTVTLSDVASTENGYGGYYAELTGEATLGATGVTATDNGQTQAELYLFDSAALTVDGITATGAAGAGVAISSESTVPAAVNAVSSTGNSPGLVLASYTADSAINVSAATVSSSVTAPGIVSVGSGSASITASTVSDNALGGIFVQNSVSPVAISNSTITRNGAGGQTGDDFGGVFVWSTLANVSIDRTTISDNTAVNGAGLLAYPRDRSQPGVLNITSSTISGNTGAQSSGINAYQGIVTSIGHTTITNNSTEGGGPVVDLGDSGSGVSHTIVADNLKGIDLSSHAAAAIDYSLVGTTGANALDALQAGTRNIVGKSAQLAPLANNGGLTLTHLPLATSPSADAGNPAIVGAPALDQRDAARIVRIIDIGSTELAAATPIPDPGGDPGPGPGVDPEPTVDPTPAQGAASGKGSLVNTGDEGRPALVLGALLIVLAAGAWATVLGARRGRRGSLPQ